MSVIDRRAEAVRRLGLSAAEAGRRMKAVADAVKGVRLTDAGKKVINAKNEL